MGELGRARACSPSCLCVRFSITTAVVAFVPAGQTSNMYHCDPHRESVPLLAVFHPRPCPRERHNVFGTTQGVNLDMEGLRAQ